MKNALKLELDKLGIEVQQQDKLPVWYEGQSVGVFFPDLWIDKQLIIEIKAVQSLIVEHEAQLINYLTATNVETGLLINFGSSVQIKRKFRDYRPQAPLVTPQFDSLQEPGDAAVHVRSECDQAEDDDRVTTHRRYQQ
jgi:GxxExxY protein